MHTVETSCILPLLRGTWRWHPLISILAWWDNTYIHGTDKVEYDFQRVVCFFKKIDRPFKDATHTCQGNLNFLSLMPLDFASAGLHKAKR